MSPHGTPQAPSARGSRGPGGFDAVGAVAAVAAGAASVEELVADARARCARWEPWLGAVVRTVSAGPAERGGPLTGAVVGVKDLIAVAGVTRGCGAPDLVDALPQSRHATTVARAAAAGAAVVATLALPPLAYGTDTPQTRNPRAPDRMTGGSSGGTAAALAAGIVHVGLGTDSGGSVRIPAACCGVVGLKPTRGLVPLTGVQPLAWSLDSVGPMATSVADTAAVLGAIAGHDPDDPWSAQVGAPPLRDPGRLVPGLDGAGAPADPARLRVGVPTWIQGERMDAEARAVWEATLDDLAAAGAQMRVVDVPLLARARPAAGRLLAAEAAALHAEGLAARRDRYPDDLRVRLEHGRGLDAASVARARELGVRLRHQLAGVFADVDVLVTPTLPCRVPPAGADSIDVGGRLEHTVSATTRFTIAWNLAGVPAGSVPAGADAGGGPVGVQVVGRWFDEPTVLGVMALIERLRGGAWLTVADPPGSDALRTGGRAAPEGERSD